MDYRVKDIAHALSLPEHKIYWDIRKNYLHAEKQSLESKRGRGFEYMVSEEEFARYKQSLELPTLKIIKNERMELLPPCHVCQRVFTHQGEYVVRRFEEENAISWYPVCKGRCENAPGDEKFVQLQEENRQLKKNMRRLRKEIEKLRDSLTIILANKALFPDE